MTVTISKQIFHNIQPIVCTSRSVGLLPVKYVKNGEKYVISLSRHYMFYSYLFGVALAGCALAGLIGDLKANPDHSLRIKDTKGAYVVSCDLGFMIVIVILGIFISPFKVDKFFLILDPLNQVHMELSKELVDEPRKTSVVILIFSYSIFLSVLAYDFIGWVIQTNGKPSAARLWNNIPVYMLYVVSWTQEICFLHMTYFVRRCVVALNKELSVRGGIQHERVDLKMVPEKNLAPGKHRFVSVYGMGKIRNCTNENWLTAEKAQIFINVHRILFGAVNLINDWYGVPLMLILLSCFLQLIGTPYFMLSNTEGKSLVFAILEVVWLFTHASRLLIIVEASDRCTREYDKINFHLCQHLERKYDHEVMHKLKVLALQINTCKVKFSTCGITNINRSMLASIAGAVTTYLVILVQFDEDSIPSFTEEARTEPL